MKSAQYTCDHCGRIVGLHETRCPGCGKFFDAVRCPRCQHQGPPASFASGCPSCRYLAPVSRPPSRRAPQRSLFAPAMAVLLTLLVVAVAVSWALRVG